MNLKCQFLTNKCLFCVLFLISPWVGATMKRDTSSLVKIDNIGVGLSSRGLGAEVGLKLKEKDKYSLRVNVAYLAYSKPQSIKMDKGSSVDIFPQVASVVLGCLIDYHPFKKKIFRLTGGLSYEIIQQYEVSFNSSSGLNLGGLQIASDDFGNIQFGMKWNALRPYVGFGFGKPNMTKRIGMSFDMGMSYMGSPKLKLGYEGFLETTTIDEEIKKIEKNMSGYSYYPYIAVQIRYNLKPKSN